MKFTGVSWVLCKGKKNQNSILPESRRIIMSIANRFGYSLTLKCLSQAAAQSISFKYIHAKLFLCSISSLLNFVFLSSNFPAHWKNWVPSDSAWMYLPWMDIFQPMIFTSAHMLEQWAACIPPCGPFCEKIPRCLWTALPGKSGGFLSETLKIFIFSWKRVLSFAAVNPFWKSTS